MIPCESGAEECVVDGLIDVEIEGDVVRLGAGEEVGELGVFKRSERVEISEDFTIKEVFLEVLIELWNFEGLIDVKSIFQRSETV